MAGIYLHIPFCKQACHYCNFHFTTSLRYKEDFIQAILGEIALQRHYLQNEIIETIYFGGGTPSLLTTTELILIIEKLQSQFTIASDCEITLEANPDDIATHKLQEWKQAGINRLSIGIQSFFEEDLQWMNRAHHARQALESLMLAIPHFNNITVDLIYGIPGLTNEKWEQNVETILALQMPHLSCYALTVEPKTPLDKLIRQHKVQAVDPEKQASQFLLLIQWLETAGYEHYEISNFSKPGMRSRHNTSYWQGKKYLGLGPSAHSYNGNERQWNIANNQQYITSIQQNTIPAEKEVLTKTQKLNEYIMTALRTKEGIDLDFLFSQYNVSTASFLNRIDKYIQTNKVIRNKKNLQLTRDGKLFADGIAADLFYLSAQ
ncbi:MAG TPA: radical SAM family heme chaperone HemW [Chitinophagaceae bacterium]|nr:radical SAM family heme chaperone HemW [Chitinophagaceae bacterium]